MTTYDEMAMFEDNAREVGLAWNGPPTVVRRQVQTSEGRVSALVWGSEPPELVLLHGGAQNAHTWDTVALGLSRPLVAIDLPGHGHSDWRADHDYSPPVLAETVAQVVRVLAPQARMVVGMSLGGLTAICLAAAYPDLVERLVVVDVTPGTDHVKAEPIIAFVSGPETFASFDEILSRTIEFNPGRSESSLRRGVLHNAKQQADGTWAWRYDRTRSWRVAPAGAGEARAAPPSPGPNFGSLWSAVDAIGAPTLLVRGGASGVVGDEDVAEFRRRVRGCEVIVVEGAGHSVQGDRPVELAHILARFLDQG